MREPVPIAYLQLAFRVYEIAHKCGRCVSDDPGKVKSEKLRLIAEEIMKGPVQDGS